MLHGSVDLGVTAHGRHLYLDRKARSRNLHIVGLPESGKSGLLEHMIRQDIVRGQGLCLIDPHGSLYEKLVTWAAGEGFLKSRNIRLINPVDDEFCIGFNPLAFGDLSHLASTKRIAAVAGFASQVVKAACQVWGGHNLDEMPRLERNLRAVFYLLAEKRLSLYEARELIRVGDPWLREYLAQGIEHDYYRAEWQDILKLPAKQFEERFESTCNRIGRFLESPYVAAILGQRENVIDFSEIMEKGEIVLVNLVPRGELFTPEQARTLGTLIVNDIVMKAQRRPVDVSPPYYLVIDECYSFVGQDIETLLDQRRKHGLFAVFAHQRLQQLRDAGEGVYDAIMQIARNKIVFCLGRLDAKEMAEEINYGRFDLQTVKDKLGRRQVTGEELDFIKVATDTMSYAEHSGGRSSGESVAMNPDGEELTLTTREDVSEPGSTVTHGSSVTEQPVFRKRWEWVSDNTTYSLEDLIYLHSVALTELKARQAVVKIPGQAPAVIRTSTLIKTSVAPRRIERGRQQALIAWAPAKPFDVAEQEIERRINVLHRGAECFRNQPEPGKDGFRQKRRPNKSES